MKRRRLTTLVICLMAALLGAVAGVAVKCWPRSVPLSQCSEVYRRYRDFPGVHAAFIKDKQINDTLSLDMTLFYADDSASFVALLKSWNKSDEFIEDLMSCENNENTRFTGLYPKGYPDRRVDPVKVNNEVFSIFPVREAVAIFHTRTEQEIDIVRKENFREQFNSI